jgi:hypothetical protein
MELRRYALLFLLLTACMAQASGPVVRVIGPDPVAADVAAQLAARLPALSIRRDEQPAKLLVAVGTAAFRTALDVQRGGDAPVIGIAITSNAYRQMPKGRHTALFWDPDPVRQLRLARVLLPGAKRAGIVLGNVDASLVDSWRREAARQGLALSVKVVAGNDTLPRQLNAVLADVDFLLGIDDPAVFAPDLAKTVLLTSYRHGKPVVGPSAAWVEAGSVASLAARLPDAIDTLVSWIPLTLAGEALPQPRHHSRYGVATNPNVARSLQLSLPSTPELESRLRDEEPKP